MGEKKNTASLLLRKHMLLKLENAITQKALDMLFSEKKVPISWFSLLHLTCCSLCAFSNTGEEDGENTCKIASFFSRSRVKVVVKFYLGS